MSIEAQQLEYSKNNNYRDKYRRVLKWLVFLSTTAIAMTVVLTYMNVIRKKPQYFATTTSGLVIPMHSLSEPVVTNNYILQWASLAARKALNIDFVHYQNQLAAAKSYFTEGGWSSFNKALKNSGLLNTVLSQKLEMSAVVAGAPLIINQSDLHGRYTWDVQMPVLVHFTSANENASSKFIVTMQIQRVPVLNATKGIQITRFIASKQVS